MAKGTGLKMFSEPRKSPAAKGSLAGTRTRMTGTNGRALSIESKYARTKAALAGPQLPQHGMTTGMRSFKGSAGKITPSGKGIAQPNISDVALRTRLKGTPVKK